MKFYWGKDHHIWTYCMHLGPYTDPDGNKFDLGVYEEQRDDPDPVFGPSFAIVYGSDDHSYKAGPLDAEWLPNMLYRNTCHAECIRRYVQREDRMVWKGLDLKWIMEVADANPDRRKSFYENLYDTAKLMAGLTPGRVYKNYSMYKKRISEQRSPLTEGYLKEAGGSHSKAAHKVKKEMKEYNQSAYSAPAGSMEAVERNREYARILDDLEGTNYEQLFSEPEI